MIILKFREDESISTRAVCICILNIQICLYIFLPIFCLNLKTPITMKILYINYEFNFLKIKIHFTKILAIQIFKLFKNKHFNFFISSLKTQCYDYHIFPPSGHL